MTYAERYASNIPQWFMAWLPMYRKYGFEADDVHQEARLALLTAEEYLVTAEERDGRDPIKLAAVIARRAVKRKLLTRARNMMDNVQDDADPVAIEDHRDQLEVRIVVAEMIAASGHRAARFAAFFNTDASPGLHSVLTHGDRYWIAEYLKEKSR